MGPRPAHSSLPAPPLPLLQAGRDPAELEWDVALSISPHPRTAELNIVGTAMGPFVFATNLFSFVMLVSHTWQMTETMLCMLGENGVARLCSL